MADKQGLNSSEKLKHEKFILLIEMWKLCDLLYVIWYVYYQFKNCNILSLLVNQCN